VTRSDSSRCPDPESLAAFVAGTLSGAELKRTAEHLNECEDCRAIVGEAARADRADYGQVVSFAPPARVQPTVHRAKRWLIALAAAAVIGIVYTPIPRQGSDDARISELAEAMPREGRYLEARLSGGFRWAPLRATLRGEGAPLDPSEMKVIGAAGNLLEKTAGDGSAEGRHAQALAHLLAGRPAEADALLTRVATEKQEAAIWSDLAAARYTAGVRTDDPAQFASALAAADEALRIDPHETEALFNRALIVERLGLRQQARAAWERYLAADRTSEWAREAQQHLDALLPPAAFGDELERHYDQLPRDGNVARDFVRRFPQEARTWGETEILGRWAAARKAGDASADLHLAVASVLGKELLALHGDRLLHDAATAVVAADPQRQAALTEAHLRFRRAQAAYKGGRAREAGELFRRAAQEFARGGSPLALPARYFEANTLYDQGQIAEARTRLEQLLAQAPPEFPAYRAQVQWQLGLVLASQARWGDAIETLSDGIRLFEGLGETKYATSVRDILAEVYDRIGDPGTAWKHRIVVLRELGRADHPKLLNALDAAARGAALLRDWPVSLALLGLKLEIASDGRDDPLYVHTSILRARIEAMRSQPGAARAELARATAAMARLRDGAYRERAEAERVAVQGMLAESPAVSIALLGKAISYHQSKGRRMLLPELLLQRGRASLREADNRSAAADFEDGIRELERQRLSIDPGEERWGVLGSVDELFEEAMLLALARDDTARAFAYAERARARELLETIQNDHDVTLGPRRGEAVLVEYAIHGAGLVIFVVDGPRIVAVRNNVARSVLEREVSHLQAAIVSSNEAEFRRSSAVLYARLIAPVASVVPPGRLVVFVPVAALCSVPFAALLDEQGTYLVERHAMVVAPSGAVFSRLTAKRRPRTAGAHLLLVSGPAAEAGDVRYLDAAREGDAVVAVYASADRLRPHETSEETFAVRAGEADVIHFVGHGVSDPLSGPALVTARKDASDGLLDAREIAAMRLRRTRVVVLAACSTARGPERSGEGNISVARAFLAAGVPSVVATLWPIEDDPATEFFPRLHRYVADGLPPAEALRRAQLDAIRGHLAPGMWAAVQVLGS
jgi:CHAT domain-containing protein/tetratricopeptide (TPR) repeat protein